MKLSVDRIQCQVHVQERVFPHESRADYLSICFIVSGGLSLEATDCSVKHRYTAVHGCYRSSIIL